MYKESKHKNHYLPKFYQEQKEIALQLSPGKMNDITVDFSTFTPTSDEFCKSEQSYEAECFEVYVNGLQNQISGPNFLLKWLQSGPLFLKSIISNVKVCTYNGFCEAQYTLCTFSHPKKKKASKILLKRTLKFSDLKIMEQISRWFKMSELQLLQWSNGCLHQLGMPLWTHKNGHEWGQVSSEVCWHGTLLLRSSKRNFCLNAFKIQHFKR